MFPASSPETVARKVRGNVPGVNVGIEPLARPARPGELLGFPDHVAGSPRTFVAEDGAVHASLTALVNELAPDEQGSFVGSQKHQFLARADKQMPIWITGILSTPIRIWAK